MKFLMAANWKMYKNRAEARETVQKLIAAGPLPQDREVVVFAPFTALASCAEELPAKGFFLGGQNCYPALEGAFTGEISPSMLRDCGCSMVLVGHSERRGLFEESDALVAKKAAFALGAGLKVVICVGETLAEREKGHLKTVLTRQLGAVIFGISPERNADICVAYEPVWAIGTGKVAGPKEIEEAHSLVRQILIEWSPAGGKTVRILYGGSVKPDNAKEIISIVNVNGVLVGGAALQVSSFSSIIHA